MMLSARLPSDATHGEADRARHPAWLPQCVRARVSRIRRMRSSLVSGKQINVHHRGVQCLYNCVSCVTRWLCETSVGDGRVRVEISPW